MATRLRASIALTNATARVVVQMPVAAVQYVVLRLDAELDVRGLNPLISEVLLTADGLALALAKRLTDATTTSDVAVARTGKGLGDAAAAGDAFDRTVSYFRVIGLDDYVAPDYRLEGYVVGESADAIDKVLLNWATAVLDSALTDDTPTLTSGKIADDLSLSGDEARLAAGKSLADTPLTADGMSLAAGKQLSDIATTSDAAALSIARLLADAAASADSASLAVSQVLADAAASADEARLLVGASYVDSLAATDSLALAGTRVIADTAVASDGGSLHYQSYGSSSYFSGNFVGTPTSF